MKPSLFPGMLLVLASFPAFADISNTSSYDVPSEPRIQQLITLQAGEFHPASVAISNGSYSFNYSDEALQTYFVELGWAAKLFNVLGGFYIEENLGFTTFNSAIASSSLPNSVGQPLSLNLLGFDTRLMYAMEWFPWHSFIPFGEAGYQYSLYYQSGPSDLESAQGSVGNPVVGAGFRLWLNRGSSISSDHVSRFASVPVFLLAKYNRIFPTSSGLNLDSESFFGGLSIGF